MNKFFHPDDFENIYSHIEDPFSPAAVDNSKLCNRISAADIANAKVSKLTEQLRICMEALGDAGWIIENMVDVYCKSDCKCPAHKWLADCEALAKCKDLEDKC